MTFEYGIIGGTGAFGSGIALRIAALGKSVIIGSRTDEKGKAVAEELAAKSENEIQGGTYEQAAKAKYVIITIPPDQTNKYLPDLQSELKDKIVIDCTVSLQFGKTVKHKAIEGGSSYSNVKRLLPESKVVAAFKTISAKEMQSMHKFTESNIVIGKDKDAVDVVMTLSNEMGLETYTVSQDTHAYTVERMTALAIQLSKKYKATKVGYKFTGIHKN